MVVARPATHNYGNPAAGRPQATRRLIADTGAGSDQAAFEILLREADCRECGNPAVMGQVHLRGAFSGWFNVYSVEIRIPRLRFAEPVPVVGVPHVPKGFDGIACFKFLNRFHYGNFGDPNAFGLQQPPSSTSG